MEVNSGGGAKRGERKASMFTLSQLSVLRRKTKTSKSNMPAGGKALEEDTKMSL